VRAAAGERGVGGSEARRGGQRWRHTPPPVAGRGGAARRGGREQLGSSKEDRVTSLVAKIPIFRPTKTDACPFEEATLAR